MRTVSELEIRALKGATGAAYQLGGGVTQFPSLTRVGVSTLSKYASFNDENADNLIPIDVAIEADRRAQAPEIVTAMAKLLGYTLVAETAATECRPVDERLATELIAECVDVVQAIIKARADGVIDQLETKLILKEAYEAKRVVVQLIVSLEAGGRS